MVTTQSSRSGFVSALRQRCPQCRQGPIFRGPITMNARCPVCGLRFEREPGYFLGAMYISYPLSVPILGLLILLGHWLLPSWRIEFIILLSGLAFIPFVPVVFRYSRVLWIYFDRWVCPGP